MYSINTNLDPHSYKNYEINFGQVPVGTTAIKHFPIKNNHHDSLIYFVTRSTKTNPIYYVFDINKYEGKVESGAEFVLKISYSPNLPGSKNYDYFKVVDSQQNYYRLCVSGKCIGPSVSCSVRFMSFFEIPNNNTTKQVFQLTNNSEVPAIFQFDCDEEQDQGVFQINTIKGTIQPKKHIYITVKFLPQSPRFYSKQLCCLILYHEPIILNLFGIFSKINYDTNYVSFRYYPFPWDETVGFKGYLSDSVSSKLVLPPVSLSINNLDFGRIMPQSSCQTLTTSFTNHMENEVEIEWETVPLFRIYPEKLTIPSQKSALFECSFNPDVVSRLSSAIINGHISWILTETVCKIMNIPIPINLRVIGHSFPKNQSWIPSISIIPANVVLPLTLPNFPSWTTFMIKSQGHLPVLYKLQPPGKTNFIMKPMIGLVRKYQIVVVQLEANTSEKNSYIEKWNIELNGQVDRLLAIYVKAQTDVPFIEVALNNFIQFEPMQPGTQSCLYLPFKNTSFCRLQYEFKVTEKFGIDPVKGELAPNEEIFVTCWYSSDFEEQGINKFEIVCQIQCVFNENCVIGPPYDVLIKVGAECTYSELCAIPQSFQCGEVQCGTMIKTNFYLYNFGESNINFKLCHNHNLNDVILEPECGRCGSKEKIMISVKFTVKQIGQHTLIIGYNNRLNRFTDMIVDDSSKDVFRIEYDSLYVIVQVADLIEHNYGYLFDKISLWEHFQIDKINLALKEVVQGEIKRVNCGVPDCEVSDKLFYAIFLIQNICNIDTKLHLKRQQLCDCKPKESHKSFTFRQKVYECPHKNMFTMEISDPYIPANGMQKLTFWIVHLLENENVLSYILELSNERTVIVNFFIQSIPKSDLMLSVFDRGYTLNLGYIYIGLREAPVQAYWIYNNTRNAVPYKLDDFEITKLCNAEGFPVLKCLNSVGFLKPYTSAPILFKFWPIEVKIYRVEVPLILGMKEINFQIEGYGTDEINKSNFTELIKNTTTNPLTNNVINLSVDHIIVQPILVSSSTERLFFIKNQSRNRDVKYHWKPCVIDGLVKIEPMNFEGFLKAKESHTVVIRITSLSEPCCIKLSLCCEFYDYTQYIMHEKSMQLARDKQNISQEIILTDEHNVSGMHVKQRMPDKIESKPERLHISLPVKINVIGVLDKDTCVSIEDQMKQKPFDGVHIDIDNFMKEYHKKIQIEEQPIHPTNEKITTKEKTMAKENKKKNETVINKEITQYVLESAVGDAVFSSYFREIVKILKTAPSPFYSQIKFDPNKRKEQREQEAIKFFTKPQLSEVTDILEDMVTESVHTTFRLGPVLRNQPK